MMHLSGISLGRLWASGVLQMEQKGPPVTVSFSTQLQERTNMKQQLPSLVCWSLWQQHVKLNMRMLGLERGLGV